jgi:hypothetical protein
MALEDFRNFLLSPEFFSVFGTSLAVVIITALAKYLTKLRLFGVSVEVTEAIKLERDAAHFDCLRMGIDLSILGLGTYLSIVQLAVAKVPGAAEKLEGINQGIVLFHIVFLFLAIIATGYYDSPVKSWKKGIVIPSILGWVSILTSVGVFYFLIKGVK